jgi:hypothetical protein
MYTQRGDQNVTILPRFEISHGSRIPRVRLAHAYTDGGLVREYAVENRKAWLEFEDQPPGHEKHWARARKILQPTENGSRSV